MSLIAELQNAEQEKAEQAARARRAAQEKYRGLLLAAVVAGERDDINDTATAKAVIKLAEVLEYNSDRIKTDLADVADAYRLVGQHFDIDALRQAYCSARIALQDNRLDLDAAKRKMLQRREAGHGFDFLRLGIEDVEGLVAKLNAARPALADAHQKAAAAFREADQAKSRLANILNQSPALVIEDELAAARATAQAHTTTTKGRNE